MIFELDGDCPMFEYSPEVIVFERIVTPTEAKERYKKDWEEPVFLYRLVIGEELVDANRIL